MANDRPPASNENPAVSVISQVLVMGTTLEVFLIITPVLQELHWLPVQARIHFKILAFKCKSSYNLRSNSGILLELPKGKMLGTPDKRAFQTAAPHYGMTCLYNYAIYNLWKHLRTQSRHCFQDNFMRSEF